MQRTFAHLFRYAHENGCEWRVQVSAAAAHGGHIESLKYVHENGCPWGPLTCELAAQFGNLECLKYL